MRDDLTHDRWSPSPMRLGANAGLKCTKPMTDFEAQGLLSMVYIYRYNQHLDLANQAALCIRRMRPSTLEETEVRRSTCDAQVKWPT